MLRVLGGRLVWVVVAASESMDTKHPQPSPPPPKKKQGKEFLLHEAGGGGVWSVAGTPICFIQSGEFWVDVLWAESGWSFEFGLTLGCAHSCRVWAQLKLGQPWVGLLLFGLNVG